MLFCFLKKYFFFAISPSFLLMICEIGKCLFLLLQFWTQDGPLPARCFLPASHLPASPETMLLGVQGRPGSRPFGRLHLPGGGRQRLVSMATFKQNYIQVSHVNLNASGFSLYVHSDSKLAECWAIWVVCVARLRGAPRTKLILHTPPLKGAYHGHFQSQSINIRGLLFAEKWGLFGQNLLVEAGRWPQTNAAYIFRKSLQRHYCCNWFHLWGAGEQNPSGLFSRSNRELLEIHKLLCFVNMWAN